MISAGTHENAKVSKSALGTTSTGKEQLGIEFMLESGETIWWYGYFTEAALKTTIKSLENLGWNLGEHDFDLSQLHCTDVLLGREAQLEIQHEEYEGVTRPRVRWVNAPGGAGGLREAMEPDEAKTFAAKLRGRLAAACGGARTTRPARSPEPVAATVEDYDIPF